MGIDLFAEKYYDDEIEEASEFPWEHIHRNGYGFIRIKNPHYMVDGDEHEFFVRKPTPAERREIIINTVIECNGRTFRIPVLAELLGVSDRTVQTVLRRLEREGLIEIIPKKTKSGAQRCNAYRYIGPPCEKYGSRLTLQVLHSPKRDAGFRGWAWKEYEFRHDRLWHNFLPFCREKFKARIARRRYLEENNLPLVIPEDTKYLVLRYCYWRGTEDELCRQFQNACMHSKDGTKKLPLYPLGRTERVKLFGRNMSVVFGGETENPQITIIDETGKQLDVFSWFDENVIEDTIELGDELVEEFVIVGDFTTK